MQFTTAFIASIAAMTASALPQVGTPVADGDRFGIVLSRSTSPIHNQPLQAAHRGLLVGANSQNATCDEETNFATFYLVDGELHLHSTDAPYQTMFVDRSGMGQGVIGFLTGAEPLGSRSEKKGWALTEKNELQFDGSGLQVCPGSFDGAWSVWLQGLDRPGFLDNCTSVVNTVYKTAKPINCLYTAE